MAKSADAFRTISEVADWLETPAHVLRFWESKFSQVKPVKRAGGRRYYRPADMKLLGGIKKLLHDDGMTIKGVQKLLREQGVAHVSDFSQPLGDAADDVVIDHVEDTRAPVASKPATTPPPVAPAAPVTPSVAEAPEGPPETDAAEPEETPITFSRRKPEAEAEPEPAADPTPEPEESPPLPSFLQRREAPEDGAPTEAEARCPDDTPTAEAAPGAPPKPQSIAVNVPEDPGDDIAADPGVLTRLSKLRRPLSPETIAGLQSLASKLRATTGPTAKG